ncbi:protein-L-isoaspartate(D-aspartate) O-methyltransferase [Desulfohalotomaculum tongense]|nr:protein-L-isoaspartate(D-aspartate) O-methyltransferase [Desulforadius tongensis]
MLQNDIYEFYRNLDRGLFIDNEYKKYAHYDQALPIGFEQTISQPSLVIEMTMMLDLNKRCRVLEIGTGSGYQTAFLAQFAGEVFTIERIAELSKKAQKRLSKLGYKNIKFKVGDGSKGWEEHSPYDRIIVTAGAGNIPGELVNQLKLGGKMVIPAGKEELQELLLVIKDENGNIKTESLGPVRFVELKGKYGWH